LFTVRVSRFFLFAFVVAVAANLYGAARGHEMVMMASKPFIMLTLMAHYFSSVIRPLYVVLGALFFCWMGDILLMFVEQTELFFIAGLASFLIGHVLYILCYQRLRSAGSMVLLITQRLRFSLPIVLAGSGLLMLLFPYLGDMKIPVTIYALVIVVMSITALSRYGLTTASSFWSVFSGALLFMLSDSLLAINKFYSPFSASAFFIMATYCTAQWLIVKGIIAHQHQYR
jgi:uncharacterized membrane protein YhhN